MRKQSKQTSGGYKKPRQVPLKMSTKDDSHFAVLLCVGTNLSTHRICMEDQGRRWQDLKHRIWFLMLDPFHIHLNWVKLTSNSTGRRPSRWAYHHSLVSTSIRCHWQIHNSTFPQGHHTNSSHTHSFCDQRMQLWRYYGHLYWCTIALKYLSTSTTITFQ